LQRLLKHIWRDNLTLTPGSSDWHLTNHGACITPKRIEQVKFSNKLATGQFWMIHQKAVFSGLNNLGAKYGPKEKSEIKNSKEKSKTIEPEPTHYGDNWCLYHHCNDVAGFGFFLPIKIEFTEKTTWTR
jgi:hypothetical protein